MSNINLDRVNRRKKRVSANIHGTAERPRISVYRSNKYIYAQAIDDMARKTVAAVNSLILKSKEKQTKSDTAKAVGMKLAELLISQKITKAVFDRNRYAYNGRVKALAEGLREGKIQV